MSRSPSPLLLDPALATVEDPVFFTDLIEGETNLLELIAALDASIVDDEILVDGAKAALDKLQARKRSAENRIELKRRLLAHTLQQLGLKTLRTPTATLTIADASLKAIAVAPEDIPARWWKPQPPKLDQDGLTKAIRARESAQGGRGPHGPGGTRPGAG
jgi:Siphovirus Gp157